jgi:hypothetical protein
VGFFAHPILEWIVRILKGESTPKSRSNFFLMTYTFTILTAIPSGIALVVAALPVPFISLLGPLLSLLVSLVGLLLYFLWFKHFRVHKAVQYIIMAFGVLAVLGAGWGFVSGLITQISNLGSGGNPGVVDTGELTDEQKALIEAAKTDPEAAAKLAEAQKMAAEAMAAAAAAGQEPDERTQKALEALRNKTAGVETPPPPADPESADDDDDDEDGEDVNALKAPPPPPPPARVEPPPPPARVEPPPPVEPPPAARVEPPPPPRRAAPTGPINTDEHPLGETDFVRFLAKRKAVEQAIEDDPSLVQRRDIRGDYETLWRVTYDIRDKYAKKYKKEDRWKREKIIGRQKDQEIFEKTRGEVDRLYAALFGGR